MTKAISPTEFPKLPEGMIAWARSTKRVGGMFHAHALGFAACGSIRLDRHQSVATDELGAMQYWGVCPRCYAKAVSA